MGTSYLFIRKRKTRKANNLLAQMDKHLSSDSNISRDSLELDLNKKMSITNVASDENVDTILVPFYENDVLVKVPKGQKNKKQHSEKNKKNIPIANNNYLINKEKKIERSYLEKFRKQFFTSKETKSKNNHEIRSLSPEYGDTERGSIGDEATSPVLEFYNTECYNEIYYEKIIQENNEKLHNNFLEQEVHFNDELTSKSPDIDNNFRSISEVSQRRHVRRATVQPVHSIKLGGLGPDMERIKPRLERARSLQRYSEKVRMENRVKIYKKSIQCENENKIRESSAKVKDNKHVPLDVEQNVSYLMNKVADRKTKVVKQIYDSKSKSADVKMMREKNKDKEQLRTDKTSSKKEKLTQNEMRKNKEKKAEAEKPRVKSSINKGVNTDNQASQDVSPVQISFLVNVGGIRPSSALRTLEEKHRIYQERVKEFTFE